MAVGGWARMEGMGWKCLNGDPTNLVELRGKQLPGVAVRCERMIIGGFAWGAKGVFVVC